MTVAVLALLAATGCAARGLDQPAAAKLAPSDRPDLTKAPWLWQPSGSPDLAAAGSWPSLVFPVGVSYGDALTQLYVSALQDHTTPSTATVADPLPAEVVIVEPDSPDQGLRLSLTAPWGWTPDGRLVRPPSIALSGDLTPEQVNDRLAAARTAGEALPEGATVDVPQLPECQIAHGSPEARPAC